jgi:hypothetical protein
VEHTHIAETIPPQDYHQQDEGYRVGTSQPPAAPSAAGSGELHKGRGREGGGGMGMASYIAQMVAAGMIEFKCNRYDKV